MHLESVHTPGLSVATHLVGDASAEVAAVIDPTRDVRTLIDAAAAAGLTITHILETHVHADFVSGARELKAALNGTPEIVCSGLGGDEWTPKYADRVVGDGESVELGSVRLDAIHTPGHTPEHVTWAAFDTARSSDRPTTLFTGDFLFVGDVGRPDLLGEEEQKKLAHALYESLFDRVAGLPDFAEALPSHGAGSLCGKSMGGKRTSTLGYERAFNASLRRRPEEEWVADLMDGMPLSPPYFKRMKRVNVEGPAVLGPEPRGRRALSAAEVREAGDEVVLLDVRPKEAFAAGHVPGCINIPAGQNLSTWAGWVVPYDRPVRLIGPDVNSVGDVVADLERIGFDEVRGYLRDGIGAWETAGLPLERVGTCSVHELNERLSGGDAPAVLDVRTDSEWEGGHIAGATHRHAGLLPDGPPDLSKDRPVAVVCGSGYRASVACSLLRRQEFTDVTNVLGGMSAWNAAGFDTVND